ncbi:MAG: alpha/beta hydrolase [Desulfobacterales bacterium]|nr:alpha/beta hydrolase [Desulfobacterales bacterium]
MMKLLIVTNRKINDSSASDVTLFGEQVNDNGASELRLAWAEKGPGGKWKLSLIPEPAPLTPDNVPSREAFHDYVQILREKNMDCVYYVHGFNRKFPETLQQAHEVHKRYGVGVIVFSWPSNPGGFITSEYRQAQAIASNSIAALDRTFEKLGSYLGVERDELCEISFNLLLHSLGNFMFEQFVRHPIFSGETRMFDNIVLNAADVDLDPHQEWTNSLKYARRVYATINERDSILDASDVINPDRLGNTARDLVSPRLEYFDLTDGKNVNKKHRHFESTASDNPVVETFFKKVLHGNPGLPIAGTTYNSSKNAYELD